MKALGDSSSDVDLVRAVLLDKRQPMSERELSYTAFGNDKSAVERLHQVVSLSDDISITHQTVFGELLNDFESSELMSIRTYSLQ